MAGPFVRFLMIVPLSVIPAKRHTGGLGDVRTDGTRVPQRQTPPPELVEQCLGLGRQYHLQRRLHSASSVSQALFRSALELARNRGLLGTGAAELAAGRRAFAEEVRGAIRRVEAIDALAMSRRAGLIP